MWRPWCCVATTWKPSVPGGARTVRHCCQFHACHCYRSEALHRRGLWHNDSHAVWGVGFGQHMCYPNMRHVNACQNCRLDSPTFPVAFSHTPCCCTASKPCALRRAGPATATSGCRAVPGAAHDRGRGCKPGVKLSGRHLMMQVAMPTTAAAASNPLLRRRGEWWWGGGCSSSPRHGCIRPNLWGKNLGAMPTTGCCKRYLSSFYTPVRPVTRHGVCSQAPRHPPPLGVRSHPPPHAPPAPSACSPPQPTAPGLPRTALGVPDRRQHTPAVSTDRHDHLQLHQGPCQAQPSTCRDGVGPAHAMHTQAAGK